MAILYRRDNNNQALAFGGDLLLLVTVFLGLLCFGSLLGLALYMVRRHRKQQAALQNQSANNPRQLMIKTIPFGGNRNSLYSEKQGLMDHSSPMPLTPDSIPEIRITFPEEEDSYGRRKSGRVVIVQVGEAGVGFVRPVPEENLPPYQQHDGFSTVNIEKIGGLKEKDQNQWA